MRRCGNRAFIAAICFRLERYDEAISHVERVVNAGEDIVTWRALLVGCHMGAGRENDARRVVSELLESAPEATCEFIRERIPLRDEVAMER